MTLPEIGLKTKDKRTVKKYRRENIRKFQKNYRNTFLTRMPLNAEEENSDWDSLITHLKCLWLGNYN